MDVFTTTSDETAAAAAAPRSRPLLSLSAAAFLLAAYLLTHLLALLRARLALAKIPSLDSVFLSPGAREARFLTQGRKLMREGYARAAAAGKPGMFRLTTHLGPAVFVTGAVMQEVLGKPDGEVDPVAPIEHEMEGKWTGVTTYAPLIQHTLRSSLTPTLARVAPRVAREIEAELLAALPQETRAFVPVKVGITLLRTVSNASGTTFLGPVLGRSEDWIKSASGYTVQVFQTVRAIKLWSRALLPLAVKMGWVPGMPELQRYHRHAVAWLKPEIRRRRQCMREGRWGGEGEEKPDDVLQWMMDKAEAYGVDDDTVLAHYQLTLGMAAIHSTTTTGTQAVFDLALHPEYVEPLRAELRRELAATGGAWTKEVLYNCKLLDSFIKESQRVNPVSMAVSKRAVVRGFTLSNGVHLPAGTVVMAPAEALNADPRLHANPDAFDAYRYYNLRTKEGTGAVEADKLQVVSANRDSINWGYGKHSCPGRFFATVEMKIFVATLLLNFDFKLKDGDAVPRRFDANDSALPDPEQEILFRRIKQ